MRVEVLQTSTVRLAVAEGLTENLSAIDASPFLLRTLNCPSLKFSHDLRLDKLKQATAALLQEYPILGGRLRKVAKQEVAQHPYLKAAPYCIDVAAPGSGVVLCEAQTAAPACKTQLNQALSAAFGITAKVVLPAWYQPLDVSALFQGKEPLLKLQLTHCSDGGCILGATLPHLLADSHSSTLLLLRLSELYRQLPDSDSTPAPPPAATVTVTAAAHAAMAAPTTGPTDEGNGEAASCRVSHSGGSISGVTFQHLRSSGKNLPKVATVAKPGAPSTAAAPPLVAAAPVACGGEDLAAGSDLVAAIERSSISMSGVAHNRLRSPSTNGTAGATGVAAISAEAGGGKGLGAYKPWCKDLLLPRGNSGVAGPATLKALSLELQSVDRPKLGTTLYWCGTALREGLAAAQAFPGASSLSSCLISIPQSDLVQLKATAAAGGLGPTMRISTNDALSALVWVTSCVLRSRPLPGSSSGSSSTGSSTKHSSSSSVFGCGGVQAASRECGALGMAIDLRQNCSDLRRLPGNYFGNAAWCLHINGSGDQHASQVGSDASGMASAGRAGETSGYTAALQAAAGIVRGALTDFRSTKGVGNALLQLIAAQQASPKSVLVRNLCRLSVKVDAFITSWQFPAHQIDFGGGPADEYCCVVRPTPPWQAAVLPSRPAEGGAQLLVTVPASAVEALKRSPVLQQLVPNASFL